MNYIYHAVPEHMEGSTLYPLNNLKDIYPEIYQDRVEKYAWRKRVLEWKIPPLGCLWNDALHFSPVHPEKLYTKLRELGLDYKKTKRFFKIPADKLNPTKTTIRTFAHRDISKDTFVEYNPNDLEKYSEIPETTIEYFKETIQVGNKPLLFQDVPHILYKDNFDVSDVEVVEFV